MKATDGSFFGISSTTCKMHVFDTPPMLKSKLSFGLSHWQKVMTSMVHQAKLQQKSTTQAVPVRGFIAHPHWLIPSSSPHYRTPT
eukprot:2405535-Amphidinium_carterae.1